MARGRNRCRCRRPAPRSASSGLLPGAAAPRSCRSRLPRQPFVAIVGIGAHETPSAAIVDDDLVEIAVPGAAARTGLRPPLDAEGVILEIEALHRGMRWQ